MQTAMHRHLTYLAIFRWKIHSPFSSLSLALTSWNESRQLRKAEKKRAETLSDLTPETLCDMSQFDSRLLRSELPYSLVVEAMFGPRHWND